MKLLKAIGISVASFAFFTGVAAAAGNPNGAGQPSQSCQEQTTEPNGFSTAGFDHATTMYAGAQPQNSSNLHSVSQYDVACYQLSN